MESRDTPTKFVLDVVALLEALGDREYIPVFLEMLDCDGPDVEGAVAACNDEYAGAFDFELGELRAGFAAQNANTAA